MFIELHLIQNFSPANLNRDETNSPKTCEFGGVPRARISSQCIKRAVRSEFKSMAKDGALAPSLALGHRTKRLKELEVDLLVQEGKDREEAEVILETVIAGGNFVDSKHPGQTNVLLFLGDNDLEHLRSAIIDSWQELLPLARALEQKRQQEKEDKKKKAKKGSKTKEEKVNLPKTVLNALQSFSDGPKAMDIALFGRMIAELPKSKVDAACQVAHALSTNKVSIEFDYWTAVDDIQQETTDEVGAANLGTFEFNSSCFYRYANVHFNQLVQNLDGDSELAVEALMAFLKASFSAIPTGKQNSMAAQNPPSFALSVVRPRGLWSLSNAFVKPIQPNSQNSLVRSSIVALDDYFGRLCSVYGSDDIRPTAISVEDAELKNLQGAQVDCLDQFITNTLEHLRNGMGGND